MAAVLCLIVEAAVAAGLLGVRLDFLAQLAPLWVYITYDLSGLRDPRSTRVAILATVAVTCAVLLVSGL